MDSVEATGSYKGEEESTQGEEVEGTVDMDREGEWSVGENIFFRKRDTPGMERRTAQDSRTARENCTARELNTEEKEDTVPQEEEERGATGGAPALTPPPGFRPQDLSRGGAGEVRGGGGWGSETKKEKGNSGPEWEEGARSAMGRDGVAARTSTPRQADSRATLRGVERRTGVPSEGVRERQVGVLVGRYEEAKERLQSSALALKEAKDQIKGMWAPDKSRGGVQAAAKVEAKDPAMIRDKENQPWWGWGDGPSSKGYTGEERGTWKTEAPALRTDAWQREGLGYMQGPGSNSLAPGAPWNEATRSVLAPGGGSGDPNLNMGGIGGQRPATGGLLGLSALEGETGKGWTPADKMAKPIVSPGKFDGSGHLAEYLAHFDLCRRANGWDHQQAGVFLGLSLTGIARRLLGGIDPSAEDGYLRLREALVARFQPANQAAMYKAVLRNLERSKGECLQAHAENVERHTRMAYPKADLATINIMAKDRYIDSLRDQQLQYWIYQSNPDTLIDAVQVALHAEACMGQTRGGQTVRATGSTMAEGLAEVVEKLEVEREANRKEREEAARFRNQWANQSTPRAGGTTGGRMQVTTATRCFCCAGLGHIRRTCPVWKAKLASEENKGAGASAPAEN